ncbi:MAG: hypothetical protein V3T86_08340 [Planctomycetota bacterium]
MSRSGNATKVGALLVAIAAVSFAFPYWSATHPAETNADEEALGAPVMRIAYIEVKGMVQQLGIT